MIHYGVQDGLSQGSVYSMLRDSRGFMWFTSYEGLNRFDGHNFKVYYPQTNHAASLDGSVTLGLVEDRYGNIWVGTETSLNRYVRKEDNFDQVFATDTDGRFIPSVHYPFFADSSEVWYLNEVEGLVSFNYLTQQKRVLSDQFHYRWSSSIINSAIVDPNRSIWLREEEGLVHFDPFTGTITRYFSSDSSNVLGPPRTFICHLVAADHSLWLGTEGGIIHLSPVRQEWTFYAIDPLADFADIVQTTDGTLYLGTENRGLYIFHPDRGVIGHLTPDNSGLSGLSTASIYLDKEGLIWINTDPEGIDVLYPKRNGFQRFGSRFFETNGFTSKGIRCFAEAPDGQLWIGSQDDGIFVFDPHNSVITRRLRPRGPHGYPENHAAFIHFDRSGRIWAGTYNGLFLSNEGTYFSLVENGISLTVNNPAHEYWNMAETSDGYLFTSTSRGLFFAPPGDSRIYPLDTLQQISAGNIQIIGNYLMIPEFHRGFWMFNYRKWIDCNRQWYEVHHFLSDFNIKHFAAEGDSILWVAATSGLLKTRLFGDGDSLKLVRHYDKSDGLPSAYIYAILRDSSGLMWLSSNRGISQFDPKSNSVKGFGPEDNVQGYEFNTNACYKSKAGDFYFGGTQGFNMFRPPLDSLPDVSGIQFTDLYVNGKPNELGDYVGELSRIQLTFDQNTFTLKFAAVDYWSKGKNRYRVKLEGYDQDWIELNQGEIRYTRIPPGQYTFMVMAANANGNWREETRKLALQIMPPWYFSYPALAMYAVILMALGWQWRQFRKRKELLKRQLLEEKSEARRLKELEVFKNRFYTNITHEFRTPLTIILGITDEIERKPGQHHQTRLDIIRQSSHNLLQLVNQVLDLAQIDAGAMKWHPIQGDIIGLLQRFVNGFSPLAEAKGIELVCHTKLQRYEMDFDPNHLRQIVNNLLSNAIKFTPENGKIRVDINISTDTSGEQLELVVTDTGFGIEREHLPHIFDRFYRADDTTRRNNEGIGIGLALTLELVTLAGGEIAVESEPGKGCVFRVLLPVSRGALQSDPAAIIPANETPKWTDLPDTFPVVAPLNPDSPRILLVDDNQTLINYLHRLLEKRFHVLKASNGLEAIRVARESDPQLIISDLMMPEMDGYELCRRIKQDESTLHIPVILLTAKATDQDRKTGFRHGADAYLLKPFDAEELIIRIEQLLAQRKRMKEKYWDLAQSKRFESLQPDREEQGFLERLDQCIHDNISDPKFKVEALARLMHMSRTSLFHELKSITDQAPSDYIRNVRLEFADQLVLQSNLTISAIATQSGFSSDSYLTKLYKKRFGITPSAKRENHIVR